MSSVYKEKINIKGKKTTIDLNILDGKPVFIVGKFLKIARIKDEICDDGNFNPEKIINGLVKNKKADIFTFDQKLPHTEPKFNYYFEWDNLAVLEINSYEDWWNNQIHNDARRMVRKAEKKGIVVKVDPLTDELVRGIKSIYDETPLRQGKPFWYYKKDFDTVKDVNSSFIERAEFISAFCDDELVGFEKIIYTGNRADPISLIAKIKDRDKAPTNALIAKSVQVCAEKGIRYLTYGNYLYGNKCADSLSDFKKRNGFKKVDIPRYYVPLTLKGEIALKLRLHKGLIEVCPSFIIDKLLKLRTKIYNIKYSKEL